MATFKKILLSSDPMGIGNVLNRYRLTVPPNQRDFSWGEVREGERSDQVQSLLKDYSEAIERGSCYFVGTLVIAENDKAEAPEVADGQQRLATSTVMLAAIRDYLCTHDEEKLAGSIEHQFLFQVSRGTREDVPRLQLNVNDRDYFKKRVLSRPDSDLRNVEPTRPSHELIDLAAKQAAEKVAEIVAGEKQTVAIDRLNEWTDFIESGAQAIVVFTQDAGSAFKIFETCNDRGLDTSQVDLLKNHLFLLANKRLDEAKMLWAFTEAKLNMVDAPALVYLRYLTIMKYGPTLEKAVMDRVKEKVTSTQRAIEFLAEMDKDAKTFVAIFSPDDPKWTEYGSAANRHLATIINDLKVEQIRPLIMAVASKFSVEEAKKALRMFVCWSVRFLICGGRGGFLDKHYSEKAHDVGQGKIKTAAQLATLMIDEEIIPKDGVFRESFATARVARNYLARYYLRALELEAKGDIEPELVPNSAQEQINLEHILPENPESDWGIPDEIALGNFRKIGNMVLLQATVNSKIGNIAFDEKKKHFKNSQFFLTSMVAKEKEWGPKQIESRQKRLAELAVKTWPIK
jgi:hypothetical protein